MVLSLLSSRNISYNIQGQSGWWRTVPMPSLSLGTFSPTHFFHPLLRATHSIESQESYLLGRPSLGTNCPSKCLRIVFINQTLEFSPLASLPHKKASRAAPQRLYSADWPQTHNQGADRQLHTTLQSGWCWVGFLYGWDVLLLCLFSSAPV